MSRSIIQTVNQSLQAVTAGSTITLDYSISYIVSEQQGTHNKYKSKIEKIKIKL